jgi:hypothetical protein
MLELELGPIWVQITASSSVNCGTAIFRQQSNRTSRDNWGMGWQLLKRRLIGPVERTPYTLAATRCHDLKRLWPRALGASLLVSLLSSFSAAQETDYAKEARLDNKGNIYVSSDDGKLIWVADTSHCSETKFANDRQTVGCRVTDQVRSAKPDGFSPTFQLEIYLKGGRKKTITPGQPILDWHFWKDGQQVAVFSGPRNGQGTYALYDSAAARLIEKLDEPTDERLLPQWAKSQSQIDDESVPMSTALAEARTKWVAKVLRQIGKIEPGMRRKDLFTVFTTEGGISNRFQQTYVHVECPYIKFSVRFKAVSDERDTLKEDPEDIIESISPPYLAWSTMD